MVKKLSPRNLGIALLAAMALAAMVFRDVLLGSAFERFDHTLDGIAFKLVVTFDWLPNIVAHDGMMAAGFFGLAFLLAIAPAALGVHRSWMVVGLIFLGLNLTLWYQVETEVAAALGQSLVKSLPVLKSYLVYSLGGFLGAFAGEFAAGKIFRPKWSVKKKKRSQVNKTKAAKAAH